MTVADRLRAIVRELPSGASVTLPADALRAWLDDEPATPSPTVAVEAPPTWRERIWTCADAVQLNVHDVAEALGRSPDWVYRSVNVKRSSARGRNALPCARLDGCLIFTAGAVRAWLESSKVTVNPEPSTRAARRLHATV
jgi:hypothetical protein